jgi:hypothetical protein
MEADWQSLNVGDRIRFVAMPSDFGEHAERLHPDTKDAYRYLLSRRRPVEVVKLDDLKLPWIRFQYRDENGRMQYHSLAVNHDGWVRVLSRKQSS